VETLTMRIGFVILFAVVLGLAIGMASAVAEFGYDMAPPSLAVSALPLPPVTGPPPKVVVEEPLHEFGEMDQTEVGRHTFVIYNGGSGPLTLGQGTASCSCTIANVSRNQIPPGESAEVTVEWKPANFFGELNKTVTFPTNDPEKQSLVLTIHGQVLAPFRFDPPNISFHGMSAKETVERTANLLVYKAEPCEILGYEWGTKKTAEHFGLVYDAIPTEELAKMKPQPKSGYKLTFVARKGMPTGPLVQTVAIKTSLKPEPITVPIYGHVTADITLIGPREFKPDMNLLYLGNVPQGTEKRVDMSMLLVGSHRDSTEFTVKKVVPEQLEVTVGKPKQGYGGNSALVPIKIVLPKTAKQQAWLSSQPEEMGEIVLGTTHPDYPELRILVRVAVVEPEAAAPATGTPPSK